MNPKKKKTQDFPVRCWLQKKRHRHLYGIQRKIQLFQWKTVSFMQKSYPNMEYHLNYIYIHMDHMEWQQLIKELVLI